MYIRYIDVKCITLKFQPYVCKCKLPPACWQKALGRVEQLQREKQALQAMIAHAQCDFCFKDLVVFVGQLASQNLRWRFNTLEFWCFEEFPGLPLGQCLSYVPMQHAGAGSGIPRVSWPFLLLSGRIGALARDLFWSWGAVPADFFLVC